MVEKEKLAYLAREEGERLATEMLADMRARVQDRLGLKEAKEKGSVPAVSGATSAPVEAAAIAVPVKVATKKSAEAAIDSQTIKGKRARGDDGRNAKKGRAAKKDVPAVEVPSKSEWTIDKLLAEIPDGESFVLVKGRSTRRNYQRDGQYFLNSKKEIATDKVLEQLSSPGWTLERNIGKKDASGEFTPEEKEKISEILSTLTSRKEKFLKEIQEIGSFSDFEKLTQRLDAIAAQSNDKRTADMAPWFIAGASFRSLVKGLPEKVSEHLKKKTWEFEEEIGKVYFLKKEELSSIEERRLLQLFSDLELRTKGIIEEIEEISSFEELKKHEGSEDKTFYLTKFQDSFNEFEKEAALSSHRVVWLRFENKAVELTRKIVDAFDAKKIELEVKEKARKKAEDEEDVDKAHVGGTAHIEVPLASDYHIALPEVGETKMYVSDDTLYTLKRENITFYLVKTDGTLDGPYSEDEIRKRAADEKWTDTEEVDKAVPPAVTSIEPTMPVEAGLDAKVIELLPDGKAALYRGASGATVKVERVGNMYKIVDGDDDSGFIYDEDFIQSIAREEGWKETGEEVDKDTNPYIIRPHVERSEDHEDRDSHGTGGVFLTLRIGEEAEYLSNEDINYKVQKRKEGYFILIGEDWDGPHTKDVLKHKAEEEGWQVVEKLVELPMVDPVLDAMKKEIQERINNLKTEVAEFRQKYAETDYEKTSAWKTLKGFFRNITPEGGRDSDTEYWKSEYREKLTELKESELELIKVSGATGKELKDSMAGLLRYYVLEEGRALYDARTQVRLDRQGSLAKIWGKYEEKVKDYGKLNWKIKLAVSLGLLGLAGATGGASIIAKRVLSGSSAAVGIDMLLAKAGIAWENRSVNKSIEREIEKGMDIDRLSQFLDSEIKLVNRDLRGRKATAIFRKTSSFLLGVVVGSASSLIGAHHDVPPKGVPGGTPAPAPFAKLPPSGIKIPPVSPFTPPASFSGLNPIFESKIPGSLAEIESQVTGAPVPGPITQGIDHTPVVPGIGATVPTPDNPADPKIFQPDEKRIPDTPGVSPVPPSVDEEIPGKPPVSPDPKTNVPDEDLNKAVEDYKVKASDGKRGLWGILDKRLPANVPAGDKNRVIQSLENLMQQRLDGMSPAEQEAVGFPTGKIDMIQRGSMIRFDKLLDADEIKEAIDGTNFEAPETPKAIPVQASVENRTGVLDATDKTDSTPTQTDSVSEPDSERVEREARVLAEREKTYFTDPRTYLQENPERIGMFNNTLGKLRMGIFLTEDIQRLSDYDYAVNSQKLGMTKISSVLKDVAKFDKSAFASYDRAENPLHYSQMKELARFTVATEKAFGVKLAQVESGETINRYTQRMATLALRTGKSIPGFFKP